MGTGGVRAGATPPVTHHRLRHNPPSLLLVRVPLKPILLPPCRRSVTGHTKTAPAGPTQELLFGSVCCSNWCARITAPHSAAGAAQGRTLLLRGPGRGDLPGRLLAALAPLLQRRPPGMKG